MEIWEWIGIVVLALVVLFGSATTAASLERDRENEADQDEHRNGLPL